MTLGKMFVFVFKIKGSPSNRVKVTGKKKKLKSNNYLAFSFFPVTRFDEERNKKMVNIIFRKGESEIIFVFQKSTEYLISFVILLFNT
jgi:hypothetical protein